MRAILALVTLSGAVGLGYQVIWSRFVLYWIGASVWSYSLVLAVFMGGLALGAAAFGPIADRSFTPLRIYAALEALAALHALALAGLSPTSPGWSRASATALAIGVLLPPSVLLGGTFPALVRHFALEADAAIAARAAWVYGLNALGAAFGSLLAAFALLPSLGLSRSLGALGALGLLVAVTALRLRERPSAAIAPARTRASSPRALLLALLFLTGFLGFALEVAWTRFFSLVLGSSTYSFAIMLAALLTGIAFGGMMVASARGAGNPLRALGLSLLLVALGLLAPLPLYPFLTWLLADGARPAEWGTFAGAQAFKGLTCFLVMVPASVPLGMTLPLGLRALVGDPFAAGRAAGGACAASSSGNVAGALAGALCLLPALGVERLLRSLGVAALGLGIAALALSAGWRPLPRPLLLVSLVSAALIAGRMRPWDPAWFGLNPARPAATRSLPEVLDAIARQRVVFFRDDPAGNVLVQAASGTADGEPPYTLLLNGKPDASSGGDMITQVLSAHLPLLLHPDPQRVLVVGLASGVTAGAALRHPIERLDMVELVGAMREAHRFFSRWNGDPLDDPRARLVIEDGRVFIRRAEARYDVIISEPSNPWVAGVGALFTSEHFAAGARALRPGGLYLQWVQAYEFGDQTLAAVMRSFHRAFPSVRVYQSGTGDLLMLGSLAPIVPDWPRFERRFAAPAVAGQLRSVRIGDPLTLLLLERHAPSAVGWIAGRARRENTDDNLFLEHQAPRDLLLGREPEELDRLDDRLRGGTAASLWRRYLRERGAAIAPVVLGEAAGAGRPIGGEAGWAVTRALERDLAASRRLQEELGALPGPEKSGLAADFHDVYAASICLEAAWSAPGAGPWLEALGRGGDAGGPLALLQADLLAIAGHRQAAREALARFRAGSPDDGVGVRLSALAPELGDGD